jgi:hypothetical protein
MAVKHIEVTITIDIRELKRGVADTNFSCLFGAARSRGVIPT